MAVELTERMAAQLAAFETAGDARAIFLACYLRMTHAMHDALAAGRFADAAWVAELVDRFAGYYFAALDAHGRGAAPAVWRLAFDRAADPATPAVESLLLGVNAHINCDLVLVLDDLLHDAWADLDAAARGLRSRDYLTVNEIIGETIDTVQEQVVAPYARLMSVADVALGPLDEWCTGRLLAGWREDVWATAIAIVEAPAPAERAELRARAAALATRRVELLREGGDLGARVFGRPLRVLHRLRLV